MPVTVYGPAYSTYARTVRLVLEEKGAPYELVEVDLLKGETKTPAHLARNPFAKVPTLDHDGSPSTRPAPSSATSTGSCPGRG
jgi:glutathione S-transferase